MFAMCKGVGSVPGCAGVVITLLASRGGKVMKGANGLARGISGPLIKRSLSVSRKYADILQVFVTT